MIVSAFSVWLFGKFPQSAFRMYGTNLTLKLNLNLTNFKKNDTNEAENTNSFKSD